MNDTLYLVTGAAGFLGGHVCKQLLDNGERVRALVLPGDPARKYIPAEAELLDGDLCDIDALDKFFDAPEDTDLIVLHCASIVSVSPDYSQKVMDVNVGGTKNIIAECLKHPNVKKLVYVSSTGAIPEQPKGLKISEPDTLNPDKVLGCYSQSKALATQAVLDAVNNDGLNASIVYPSGILGPYDPAIGETTGTMIKIINGEMPAGINGSFNLADVRDLARGTILAAEKGKNGEGYILGNEEVAFKDFAKLVVNESGCKPVKLFLPIPLANLMAMVMETKAKKQGTKPMMTRFSVYNLSRNNAFDYQKAHRELGYTTRSYRETIRDEIAWLKENDLVKNV